MSAVENSLLAISQIPANTGHSLHKGTPREAFIREFLSTHLSETVSIGTGEIIDANSKPNEPRNQIDIIVARGSFPKLDFHGGVNGFLIESVIATIEVKSSLDKADLEQRVKSSRNLQALKRNLIQSITSGPQPPSVLNYDVAYNGPARMDTICGWITTIHAAEGISYPTMGSSARQRLSIVAPSIDGVFVLGKGFVYFDNVPYGFVTAQEHEQHPETKWVVGESPDCNLLLLFLFLTNAISGLSVSWIDPMPYLANFSVSNISYVD